MCEGRYKVSEVEINLENTYLEQETQPSSHDINVRLLCLYVCIFVAILLLVIAVI